METYLYVCPNCTDAVFVVHEQNFGIDLPCVCEEWFTPEELTPDIRDANGVLSKTDEYGTKFSFDVLGNDEIPFQIVQIRPMEDIETKYTDWMMHCIDVIGFQKLDEYLEGVLGLDPEASDRRVDEALGLT